MKGRVMEALAENDAQRTRLEDNLADLHETRRQLQRTRRQRTADDETFDRIFGNCEEADRDDR